MVVGRGGGGYCVIFLIAMLIVRPIPPFLIINFFSRGSVNTAVANQGGGASFFGSDEFAMFAAILRSSFENTVIKQAVRLSFISEVHES